MFKHYLTTALRHFRQHLVTTSINVACLALGLTCFLAAWGVTAYYSQSDSHHELAARTYVMTTKQSDSGFTMNVSPWLLAEHLRADFPQLETVARVLYPQETALTAQGTNTFAQVAYADAEFLDIFDLPIAGTNARAALDRPRSVIVSKALALRLFGSIDVVGKTLRVSGREQEVEVTGVVDAITQASHISTTTMSVERLSFEAMMSMDMNRATNAPQNWDDNAYFVYVVLPKDGALTVDGFNAQLDAFSKRHISGGASTTSTFRARPISDFTAVNLDSLVAKDKTGLSSDAVLMVLGVLVLLVACLNYANLATAQAATRAKEIALRRVVGANRAQVMTQHFVEALLLTCAALGTSLLLLVASLSAMGGPVLAELLRMFAAMPVFWMMLAGLLFIVSVVVAGYPALVLARVQPALALRGAKAKGGSRVAALLVGLQFGSASFLLISMLVMNAQNKAMRAAIWSPANDPVVVIGNDLRAAGVNAQLFKQELLRQKGVNAVTMMHRAPWSLGGDAEPISAVAEAGAQRVSSGYTIVDADMFTALNTKLLAGRGFEIDRLTDKADLSAWHKNDSAAAEFNIVVDRSFVKRLGFATPEAAIDRIVFHPTSHTDATPPQRLRIVGVAEDTTIRPINLGGPSFYLFNDEAAVVPIVRIAKQDVAAALAAIDATWKQLAPEVPIKRRFADEQYEASYRFLNIVSGAFSLLAGFAIVIASMGLIGMALHIIRRRTHEIGVRKTLGASVGQILWMLLRNFSKPIVIANMVAWPLAYVVMRGYLSLFAHQAGLSPAPFIITLVVTVAIAWLAVAWQATRAARMNPATVLRYE